MSSAQLLWEQSYNMNGWVSELRVTKCLLCDTTVHSLNFTATLRERYSNTHEEGTED